MLNWLSLVWTAASDKSDFSRPEQSISGWVININNLNKLEERNEPDTFRLFLQDSEKNKSQKTDDESVIVFSDSPLCQGTKEQLQSRSIMRRCTSP